MLDHFFSIFSLPCPFVLKGSKKLPTATRRKDALPRWLLSCSFTVSSKVSLPLFSWQIGEFWFSAINGQPKWLGALIRKTEDFLHVLSSDSNVEELLPLLLPCAKTKKEALTWGNALGHTSFFSLGHVSHAQSTHLFLFQRTSTYSLSLDWAGIHCRSKTSERWLTKGTHANEIGKNGNQNKKKKMKHINAVAHSFGKTKQAGRKTKPIERPADRAKHRNNVTDNEILITLFALR